MKQWLNIASIRRGTLLTLGTLAWCMVIAHFLMPQPAQSFTPFVNNVRRALNECKVLGRLANEVEGQNKYISFTSRIICADVQTPAKPTR